MTKEQKLAMLETWRSLHEQLDTHWDQLRSTTGASVDSPLGDAVWKIFAEYTVALSDLLDDDFCYLHWYWLDNDMGTRGLDAGTKDDMRKIESLDDLLWIIDCCGGERSG